MARQEQLHNNQPPGGLLYAPPLKRWPNSSDNPTPDIPASHYLTTAQLLFIHNWLIADSGGNDKRTNSSK